MQTTMPPVTPAVICEDTTTRSYLEALGELGFLEEIRSSVRLAQQAGMLAIPATVLTLIAGMLIDFLIDHAPRCLNHQLLMSEFFVTGSLTIAAVAFSVLAIRAALLNNCFEDAVCQVVASDVALGQPFTALFTLKPKTAMTAKTVEVNLIGSRFADETNASVRRRAGGIWTTDRHVCDRTVVVAQNLSLNVGQHYKVEQQLVIPADSSMNFSEHDFDSVDGEYKWSVVLRVKRSLWFHYVAQFPLDVLPQTY